MYYYLSYTGENHTRIKIWQITEQKQKGWCKLAWTHTIDNGVLSTRQLSFPGEAYTGRLINVIDENNIPCQTVKIYGPMGSDNWVTTDVAMTLEEIQ